MKRREGAHNEILESFENCKVFCRHFPDPLLVIDEEGNIVDGSDDTVDFFGERISRLIGKKVEELDLWSKEDAKRIHKLIGQLFKKRSRNQIEVEIKKAKETESSWIQIIPNVLTDRTKKEALAFLIFQDITCTRSAEQKLEESEMRYRELFDNMRSGVAIYTAVDDGKEFMITDFNKAAEKSDKIKAKNVINKTITEVFPGIEKIGFLDVLTRVWKSGKPEYFPPTMYEDERIGKVWWEDYVYKLPSGEIVATFANVSERMAALEDLHVSMKQVSSERDKTGAIIESLTEAVFVVDRESKIMTVNHAAEELIGMDRKEAIGAEYTDVMHLEYEGTKKNANDLICQAMKSGKNLSAEHQLIFTDRDGAKTPVAYSISPLHTEDAVTGAVITLRDTTDEREADRLKTEFVSIASHQMHVPLTSAKWFLDLLLKGKAGPVPGEQRKYIEQIAATNERLMSLVENLLTASHIGTASHLEVEKKPADLIAVIDQSIQKNKDILSKNKISLEKNDHFPKTIMVLGDEKELFRAVDTLINNAIRYSKPRGTVQMMIDQYEEGEIVFSIKDNGYGIPPRQQSRVFDRFFRADNIVTKVTEGAGLSLFTAKNIIESHGGRIWFDSVENVGSTFYIALPKTQIKKRKRSRPSKRKKSGE